MNQPPQIFDPKQLARQRARAQADYENHHFLHQEMTVRLAERLDDITRTLPKALALGCAALDPEKLLKGRAGIESVDLAEANEPDFNLQKEHYDLAFAPFCLSSMNDPVGALIQLNRSLKPDGLLLVSAYGGETLYELRESLAKAEMQISGGISPRIAPTIDVRDAGNLLSRAGFALPVADSDILTASYETPFHLMHELRGMGEGNALHQRPKHFTRRSLFIEMIDYYQKNFSDDEGRILASFEIVTLTAWKPHASQQQPLKRGSGKVSLTDALKPKS